MDCENGLLLMLMLFCICVLALPFSWGILKRTCGDGLPSKWNQRSFWRASAQIWSFSFAFSPTKMVSPSEDSTVLIACSFVGCSRRVLGGWFIVHEWFYCHRVISKRLVKSVKSAARRKMEKNHCRCVRAT